MVHKLLPQTNSEAIFQGDDGLKLPIAVVCLYILASLGQSGVQGGGPLTSVFHPSHAGIGSSLL